MLCSLSWTTWKIILQHHLQVNRKSVRLAFFLTTTRKIHADASDITFYPRSKICKLQAADFADGPAASRKLTVAPYFSRRQFTDPLVSTVLDSASTSKPRLSRYFSVSTEPPPIIETP